MDDVDACELLYEISKALTTARLTALTKKDGGVFSLVFDFHLLNVLSRSEIVLQSTWTGRFERLRLSLRSFVLDRLWIPGEHGRGMCW